MLPKHLEKSYREAKKAIDQNKSVLLVGVYGSGKTSIAKEIAKNSLTTANQQSLVYNIKKMAGLADGQHVAASFRAPHHTVSCLGLKGDGKTFRPGEMSLAHDGILFLDEVNEFSKQALETIAHAFKTKQVDYPNAPHLKSLPADFKLIAAMNPCLCERKFGNCTCTSNDLVHYWKVVDVLKFDKVIFMDDQANTKPTKEKSKSPQFDEAFEKFMKYAQDLIDKNNEENCPNIKTTLEYSTGKKYVRVIIKDNHGGQSVFCFVDKETGDVLKPDGWKKPAKHARGNIFTDDPAEYGITAYGPRYLR